MTPCPCLLLLLITAQEICDISHQTKVSCRVIITDKAKPHRFLGFFQDLFNLSTVPFILSSFVSSLFAVTIHSMNSFLLVKERPSKKDSAFLFFLKAVASSSGNRTALVLGSTY